MTQAISCVYKQDHFWTYLILNLEQLKYVTNVKPLYWSME